MRHGVRSICLSAVWLSCVWAGLPALSYAATADDGDAPPPGHVSAFDGTAQLERENEVSDLETGLALVPGDRVRTEAGRVEVTLVDGTMLHLDRYSEIDWSSDFVVRLGRGRLLVTIPGNTTDRLSIDAPGALVRFDGEGQYRISVGGEDAVSVELAVIRGSAELVNDAGALRLAGGQRSVVRDGEGPTPAEWFNATASSTLERWAEEQLAYSDATPAASRTYLPNELGPYAATFDRYGTWQTDASYGYVWYPTVAVDWRPYHHGRWSHMRRYGWTWVAHDPWGWPTHHYGRWELSGRGLWFWVPSRRWGPAWVYWATTPSYVGWCPLGWNGRPVANVFAYGGVRHYRGRDPWRAWSVSSIHSFGRPGWRRDFDRRVFDRDRPTFVMQHVAPGIAPPRRPVTQRADGRGWGTGAPVRRPGGASSGGSWGDPARATSRRGSSWGDPARGSAGSSWGDPARNSGGSSWGDPARGNGNRPTAARPGYASPRITDPGPRDDSPSDRARVYSDPRDRPGTSRSPSSTSYRRVPSAGDDDRRSPYGPYATPRRAPDRDDNDGNGRSYGARPGFGSRPSDPGPRPGTSAPSDRGQGRSYAGPRGGSRDRGGSASRSGGGDGGSRRSSGGDGGSRGASPRRRP